jgi:hypothetical protein
VEAAVMAKRLRGQLRDGWVTFSEVPGWESHTIAVKVGLHQGRPVVTSLRIDAVEGTSIADAATTGHRVRTLPLLDLASVAHSTQSMVAMPGLPRAMSNVAERKPPKHDKRAVTTVEQVAEIWGLARAAGHRDPRAQVCKQLSIATSTADRYLRRAEQAGLINRKESEQ